MDGPSLTQLADSLRAESRRLGFALVGIAPAVEATGYGQLQRWLESGYAGEMGYFERRKPAYSHPRYVLEGVRSLVLLGLDYNTGVPGRSEPGHGRVSRYAWGRVDYHDLIWGRLEELQRWLESQAPGVIARGVVDTAPLLEREFAQLAGLGWRGKNTLLINPQRGSYFFLAALLTDLSLPIDASFSTDHCGTCRRCLDACPTNAFPQPYVLDATKCISYLTVELRSAIPESLRGGLGDWLLGCDICQEVCPWNRFTHLTGEADFLPRQEAGLEELVTLFGLSEGEFRDRYRHTPLWRPRRRGILRNAAIVLGNQRHAPALAALSRALQDEEELIRGAAAWALGQIGTGQARDALLARRQVELDAVVREELERALEALAADAGG